MVAIIEEPFALLQKPIKMSWLDVVKSVQMSLCLAPKIFYSINMSCLFGKFLRMIDSMMIKCTGV